MHVQLHPSKVIRDAVALVVNGQEQMTKHGDHGHRLRRLKYHRLQLCEVHQPQLLQQVCHKLALKVQLAQNFQSNLERRLNLLRDNSLQVPRVELVD